MKKMMIIWGLCLVVAAFSASLSAEPAPGIGLLIKPEEMPALREKIKKEPWKSTFEYLKKEADKALAVWPPMREEAAPHLGKILDLTIEFDAVTKDPVVRETMNQFRIITSRGMCSAAFVYLITGKQRYADLAYDILLHMGKVNRWGWFAWSGTQMPHIHAGMFSRNTAFALDFMWDGLTDAQRKRARDIIAEKSVEPYYRLVLHSPGIGLHHLRRKNQGSNVMAGAMIACLALGDDYPNAGMWSRSFVQTFHWLLSHDIGWAGQALETGMPGYWSVSMQNLYTGAVCLNNAKGIDLRSHPGFAEATYYPIYHETTVPSVGMFDKPIDPDFKGHTGVISGKPISVPTTAAGGPWWYDYAARFPESPAMYFINREMVKRGGNGTTNFFIHNCHQSGHFRIIGMLWTHPELYDRWTPGPSALFKTTDRMSMIRSGYGMGHTYMYFNGDIFVSALNEILCATSGISWHFKWHGWQKAETGVETEGEHLAPSMVVKDSWHDDAVSFIHTVSGTSNITYYKPGGHDDAYKRYLRRDRDILYVRDEPGNDYFVFVDRVAQKTPRWHGWLWQGWNSVHGNKRENYGRYRTESKRRVRLERPNADLAIEFVTPKKVAFEIEDAASQPATAYMADHNVITLRALAGGHGKARGKTITIPPDAWKGEGKVVKVEETEENAPDAAYQLIGRTSMVADKGASLNEFKATAALSSGARCRMTIACRKKDMGVYENLCWRVNIELLDADGNTVAAGLCNNKTYDMPNQYSLRDPRSMTKTTPWLQTEYTRARAPRTWHLARRCQLPARGISASRPSSLWTTRPGSTPRTVSWITRWTN